MIGTTGTPVSGGNSVGFHDCCTFLALVTGTTCGAEIVPFVIGAFGATAGAWNTAGFDEGLALIALVIIHWFCFLFLFCCQRAGNTP
jgi:hypothetical protein